MNKHDSERIAGLLEAHGLSPASSDDEADIIVFNTCAVRESADERLYGQVASLKALKNGRHPQPIIAVGGCIGQRDGEALLRAMPHVDVVFGTHNIHELPSLIESASSGGSVARVLQEPSTFASDLPSVRERPWHAWVPVSVGCDNRCSYCIVPYVRGPERSRPFQDVVDEVEALAAEGVVEITLLGQNVNSYGRDLYGRPRFAELLRAIAQTGVPRIGFATSHPKDLDDDIIRAFVDIPTLMPYLHLPVQHGSDAILLRMNRGYTRETYMKRVARLRAAMPDITLSTDIIVGFPGETDADFEQTMALVKEARFDRAFTFIYSPREGTPAASLADPVPPAVAHERFERLAAVVRSLSLKSNESEVGMTREALIEGPSRRDPAMLSARTPHNRLVHLPAPEGHDPSELAGTFHLVTITEAHPWFLIGRFAEPV